MGDNAAATADIVAALQRRYPSLQASTDLRALTGRRGLGVYVALGPSALAAALGSDAARPLISTFVSGQTFTRLTEPDDRAGRLKGVTAIFAEASPAHQMQLIRAVYSRRVTVGVFLSASTQRLRETLNQAARAARLDIEIRVLNPSDNVVRALSTMTGVNALLTLPDRDLYTPDTVRLILESTYRRGQGVIGFSSDMVAAGALAAAYSNIDDTVAQVGDVAEALAQGKSVEPQHPVFWRVAINESVARSLNIVLDPAVRLPGNPPPPP